MFTSVSGNKSVTPSPLFLCINQNLVWKKGKKEHILEVGSTSRIQQLKCRDVSISATKNTDLLTRGKSSQQLGCSVLATATDRRAGRNQVCRTNQPMCKQSFHFVHCCITSEIKCNVLCAGTRALRCLLCPL